jgi:transposase InsO family protein
MKWPEVYAVPNQEATSIAEVLVTNNFCRFDIPRELQNDQGCNFESHLLQEVLQRLGVSKTRTTSVHPQSEGKLERYINTIEEHLQKVVTSHNIDWNEKLTLFLLAYRASTYDTMRLTPASLAFGEKL